MIRVSRHAIQRYKQRVAMVTNAEARAAILAHETILDIAAKFAGKTAAIMVHMSDGVRFVVRDSHVLTVLGPDCRFNHPRKAA